MHLTIALALLFAPAAANPGLRATYEDAAGQKLVIETSEAGDARVNGPDVNQYGLVQSGHFYLVAREEGHWTVARIEDVAAALDHVSPPIFKSIFGAAAAAAPNKPAIRTEAKGKGSFMGREGQKYWVYYPASEKPDDPTGMLISNDAELAPVGEALKQFTIATTVLMSGLIGPAAAEDVRDTRAVFALGTPLMIEGGYRLTAVEKADISHERMELPAKASTLEELIAHTKVRALTPEELAKPDANQPH